MSVGKVSMIERQPSGVASNFNKIHCVISKLEFRNNHKTTIDRKGHGEPSAAVVKNMDQNFMPTTTCINKTPMGNVLVHKSTLKWLLTKEVLFLSVLHMMMTTYSKQKS